MYKEVDGSIVLLVSSADPVWLITALTMLRQRLSDAGASLGEKILCSKSQVYPILG